ncbi:hypothetical protein [Microbacterium sp. SLBN-146]|uniref:hypothetical protein n=1 Tax=Microbacterium sp. SLBN-146 TaxID=2768457 RepID=UPI0011544E94|nr:hypothetical protein [Microbacterium sp. SLBN-146]TQJ30701.1 hypothetical protein FBY39_1158 [Microbacterium sp. SLBN-146]
MTAEAFFDAENVFYGLNARQRPAEEPLTIQESLFGAVEGTTRAGDLRTLLRVVDLIVDWFERESGTTLTRIDTYGKPQDPAVIALLSALSADDDTFARVLGSQIIEPRVDRNMLLAVFRRRGTTVVHHSVGVEKHAAETVMVEELRVRLASPDRVGTYLLGGEDHDALFPADHLSVADPGVEFWFVVPVGSAAWRRAHRLGSYRHLDERRFAAIGEIIAAAAVAHGAPLDAERDADRRRITATIARAQRDARAVDDDGVPDHVGERLAALIGVHEAALAHTAVGSSRWREGIGDVWLQDAVDRHMSSVAGESELAAMRRSGIAGGRAAQLVRQCGILQIQSDEAGSGSAALLAYLSRMNAVFGYTTAISALATVVLRSSAA